MVSVTTDRSVAEHFAGSKGTVFEIQVPASQMIAQTLPDSGESEFLIINGTQR